MTKRIFRSICVATLCVLLSSLAIIMGALYNYFSNVQKNQLREQTALVARGVTDEGAAYLDGLGANDFRITWIAADGTVLYDSRADASAMENHLGREEVKSAIDKGYGESSHYSATLLEKLLYAAQRLPDGTVVRLADSQNSVVALTLGMLHPIVIVAVLAVIISLALASRLAKRIVKPLNALDLDKPLSGESYDELSPLLRRIDEQQREIKRQSDELERKRDEFEAVTGSMNEGLLLLSDKGVILSINNSAAKLLNTDRSCIGQDMLRVERGVAVQELLSRAQSGEHAEGILPLGGGEYQLDASPVISDGRVSGAVLLMFDVSERENAERMRREFTANVSHELKTPLHSISGCAELLNNGMVKLEDQKRFTSQIYSEAQRMIRLVDDIIRLSRLDEGAEDMKREKVDLYAIAESVADSLKTEADAAGIEIALHGEHAEINGIPQLLSGIIYNLCDNAIKYNRPQGRVDISVENAEETVVLSVSDTGIGIPPEHQSRVFERFYRVDKSRSKEIGGTGLGLSIVKHAARLHDAKLELQSAVNEGTTITLSFAK